MNDSFLWYNTPGWDAYGLAVPNWSNDRVSQNDTIRELVSVVGRNLSSIMWHTDARLRKPPSINTLTRMHKLCVRFRQIVTGRAVASGTPNMEPLHVMPAPEEFLVYPTPYFRVRNQWLKTYCGLILSSLAEAMQHGENAQPIEISTDFASVMSQYIGRVYRMMAVELLQVPLELASSPTFMLTEEQLKAYAPSKWFTSTEMIDTVPDLLNWPTEDQLEPLTNGIFISQLPVLSRWPSAPTGTVGATGATAATASTGTWPGPPAP